MALKTTLVANWRAVLKHAWSIRFIALALVLQALELALPLLQPFLPIGPGLFSILSAVATAAAGAARLVAQKSVTPPANDPDFETGD